VSQLLNQVNHDDNLEHSKLSKQERQDITRCYFQKKNDYDLRLTAPTAKSYKDIESIIDGMKQGAERVLLYTAISKIRPVPDISTYQVYQDPLYITHSAALDTAIKDAEHEWGSRPEAHQMAWSALRGGGLDSSEEREAGPMGVLRERFGSLTKQTKRPSKTTRRSYRYPDNFH
jgi:hypothetical protein